MVRCCVSIAIVSLLFAVSFSGEGFPQESPETTHVVISPTAGLPGQEIALPIYLETAAGVEVGSVTLDLVLPDQWISFVAVQGSLVSEMAGARITAELRAGAEDEGSSVLRVALSTSETGSQVAIPDGLLGFISLALAEEAELGNQIVLSAEGSAVTAGPSPVPVDPLTIHDGVISVGEAIFACFFYMH